MTPAERRKHGKEALWDVKMALHELCEERHADWGWRLCAVIDAMLDGPAPRPKLGSTAADYRRLARALEEGAELPALTRAEKELIGDP